VPSGPLTPEEVSAFVAEHVAPYKKVRAVEFIDEIPKIPSGKVLRRVLIEREAAPSGQRPLPGRTCSATGGGGRGS
jgi:acyl-coenzyme A synthetase/AMP-(fatty) acid ligase